jgi:hypothetical protein
MTGLVKGPDLPLPSPFWSHTKPNVFRHLLHLSKQESGIFSFFLSLSLPPERLPNPPKIFYWVGAAAKAGKRARKSGAYKFCKQVVAKDQN